MEHTKVEVARLESAEIEAIESSIRELSDLQLALAGGGSGDVTLS